MTGYYVLTVTNSNGCSTNGSISGKITVNPLPTAGTITGANEVCVGSTTTLGTGTMTGGSGTYSSTIWSSSASSNATVSATGVVTGVAGGSTNISYTVTDSKGCISPSSTAFSVTVNAVPIINSLSDTTKVCDVKEVIVPSIKLVGVVVYAILILLPVVNAELVANKFVENVNEPVPIVVDVVDVRSE